MRRSLADQQTTGHSGQAIVIARHVGVDVQTLVTHDEGYRLSEAGRALLAAMLPLNAWAERWLGPKGKAR